MNIESDGRQIVILSVHLSLGNRAREQQLNYIAQIIRQHPYFIIMGDMNCPTDTVSGVFKSLGLAIQPVKPNQATYPRWKPKHCYDQIWVSQSLDIVKTEVLNLGVSDHLPIAMEIEIPPETPTQSIPKRFLN